MPAVVRMTGLRSDPEDSIDSERRLWAQVRAAQLAAFSRP